MPKKKSRDNAKEHPPEPKKSIADPVDVSSKESEEWKAKNARAKAIIMSTLVPGSEPWKIAEPLELASDIWKALEDRYAPKNAVPDKDEATSTTSKNSKSRQNIIAQWVEGKPFSEEEKGAITARILSRVPQDILKSGVVDHPTLTPAQKRALGSKQAAEFLRACEKQDQLKAAQAAAEKPQEQDVEEPKTKQKESGKSKPKEKEISKSSKDKQQQQQQPQPIVVGSPAPDTVSPSPPLDHRKREAQAAAAKILMEHMPSRDQRFLWALLHGGKEETMAWFNGTNPNNSTTNTNVKVNASAST